MSTGVKVLIGFICGIVVVIGIPLLILATGVIDWGATAGPGRTETAIANWALDRSIAVRASKKPNPFANQPAAVASGLNHFREDCVSCHGAPGVEPSEAGRGLTPAAPKLEAADVQQLNDGEMFWIIQNGIRFTGMPAFGKTHGTNEIWEVVSFIRHLPHLSPDEVKRLSPSTQEAEHYH